MDSAIGPLQREFVEIDEPYCSDVSGCGNIGFITLH